MVELVAVQSGFALFKAGEVGVIIDTQDLNPYDPQPLATILASGEWSTEFDGADVPSVCSELAEVALEGVETDVSLTSSANDQRLVRVPKKVQESAKRGYDLARGYSDFTPMAESISQTLATGVATVDAVKRTQALFSANPSDKVKSALGGDAGREWAARICGAPAITAAAPPGADTTLPVPAEDDETDFTDPTAPHEFVTLAGDDEAQPVCAVCQLAESDPIHAPADDDGVTYFATFIPGGDTGRTFKVDHVMAKDVDGAWWIREYGEWSPTQAPDAEASILELDHESFEAAVTQLDEPGTSYAELSISEDRLFQLAEPYLDYDVLDAVFAAAPYVPPEVRSANAKKQMRDAKGHFVQAGGTVVDAQGNRGQITGVHQDSGMVDVKTPDGQVHTVAASSVTVDQNAGPANAGTGASPAAPQGNVVARLPQPAPLITDLPALLVRYSAKWDSERSNGGTEAVTSAGAPDDSVLIPPGGVAPTPPVATDKSPADAGAAKPSSTDPNAPDPAPAAADDPVAASGVTPLYLAEVDPHDTGAVLAVFAVIPAQEQGGQIQVFKRDAGKWVTDPADQQALTGPTPPAITELTPSDLKNVLSQMDPAAPAAADAAPEDAAAAASRSLAAAGYALMQRFELGQTGLTASQMVGARLLSPYRDATTYPSDIQDRLNEFLLGKEATPNDVKNTDRLREYWAHGEGAAKIQWGRPGDWQRCVDHLGKFMGERAKGYCTLRHHDALGVYPGQEDGGRGHHGAHAANGYVAALVGEVQDEDAGGAVPDPDLPHEYVDAGDTDLVDGGNCAICDRGMDHPIHVVVLAIPSGEPDEGSPEEEAQDAAEGEVDEPLIQDLVTEPHQFAPGPEGLCECGHPVDHELHSASGYADGQEFSGIHAFELSTYADDEPSTCACGRPHTDRLHAVAIGASALLADGAAMAGGQRFRIPLVIPEGVESGDGRQFAQGALSSRPMPLALMWQPEGDEGHKGSVIVGRIDHVERTDNGLGNAYGVFDSGPYGQEALRLVRAGMLRGISADLDEFEAQVLSSDEEDQGGNEMVSAQKLMVNKGRLMGITLVAKPAYAECVIELVDGDGESDVADGEYVQDTGDARVAALIASAAPLSPPTDWFKNPRLDKPTHLSVTDDGRVYGHIAAWDVDHIGLPFGTRAPRSASNYAYFRTGVIRTEEGNEVPVGQLTLTGGHAPLKASAQEAVRHYDDTASAVADLAAGEDQFGIWVAGALRPGVTPEQVRALRASSPSGDWRPIKGKLELVAVCQVNVPGFPVARAMVASGVVTALVAAGALALEERPAMAQDDIDRRIAVLEEAERRRLESAANAIRERMTPVLNERQATLTAAAMAARERVDLIRQERLSALLAAAEAAKDRVRPERAELRTRAAELKARVAAGGLHVEAPFEEAKHPRGDNGRFREILGRLESMLKGEKGSDAHNALQHVQDAAGKEAAGDHKGAAKLGAEAADKLDSAAKKATGDVKARLNKAAHDVRGAVAHAEGLKDPNAEPKQSSAGEVLFDALAKPVQEDLRVAIDHAEAKLNPGDVDPKIQRMKKYLEGVNPMDARQVHAFIKNNLKQAYTPAKPNVGARVAPGTMPAAPQPIVH